MIKMNKKKALICAVLILIVALPAVFLNNIFGYLPLLMVLLSIAGSFFYLMILRKTIAYEERSDLSNCIRGTEIDFKVYIRNKFLLYFPRVEPFFYISDLFGNDDSITSDIITLAPAEERKFDFSVRFDHIGTYSAGLRKVEMQDSLGIFTHTESNPRQYRVTVVPKIYDVEKLPISKTAVSESDRMLVPNPMDSTDYTGVREYVIGDPIKNIHWKLSARTENYMTKQFESYTNTGICIILDFCAPEYDKDSLMGIFDSVIETGLSIGVYAVKNGLESKIIYYNKDDERAEFNTYEKDEFADIIETMPKIHTEERKFNAVQLLHEEGNALYSQGNIAICTAQITEDLMNTLVGIKNLRKNPMLFAMVPKSLEEEERKKFLKPLRILDDAGIMYHILSSAEELEGGGRK